MTNELSAHMSEINGILIVKIEKIKACDGSVTAKIKKTFIEMNKKFSKELSKINNEVDAEFERFVNKLLNEEVNAEFEKINIKLNSKLDAEIEFFKACNARYASEAQRILSNFEKTCYNEFGKILSKFNTSLKAL
ncbi:hypothetical protein C1645_820217 [Glomus cerebriforme]|uniref:Uncharacterized protein n=1 Tax=Glomus cerebriforme TaxID=658196 RepID=A0A397T3S8_9GLOM|nr:hypothetical protein C1645_820217 [Glomus cerebriforme]